MTSKKLDQQKRKKMPAKTLGKKKNDGKLIKFLNRRCHKLGEKVLKSSKIIRMLRGQLRSTQRSCEKWQKRALEKSKMIREQQWKIRDLDISRNKWRAEARNLKVENQLYQQQIVRLEACSTSNLEKYADYELIRSAPLKNHRYPLWQMQCSTELYLHTSQGFRSIAMMWQVLQQYLPIQTPHFNTIRSWVLRLGYYKLHQPIEKAEDWILILDYTLQMGKEQCLLILGVRQSELIAAQNWHPTTEMVRVLDLSLTPWPNTAHVKERLSLVLKQTGQVLQINADGARAIQNGIAEAAQQLNLTLLYSYDISHLIANQLKKLLKDDPCWKDLEKAINKIQKTTQQTTAGFLTPPSLRKKARYMNLFKIAQWTKNIIAYEQRGDFHLLATQWSFNEQELQERFEIEPDSEVLQLTGSCESNLISQFCKKTKQCVALDTLPIEQNGEEQFNKRFSVLEPCKGFILQLQQLLQLVTMLSFDLKNNGLSKAVFKKWEEIAPELFEPLARQFWTACLPALKTNVDKLAQGQTYLASSDIIESIFGQYKAKGQNYWLKGITEQVLFMPALTQELNTQIMQNALVNTPYQKVLIWFEQQREGRSFLAKRREALSQPQIKKKFRNDLEELFLNHQKKEAKVVRKNFSPKYYYLTA